MIKIFYASSLCSENVLKYIFETSSQKPGLAIQKFHRLIVEGMGMHPAECKVETLSTIPVTATSHKKRFWKTSRENVNNVSYRYVPLINFAVIKNLGVFIYTLFSFFFRTLFKRKKEKKVIICDVLNLSITAASLLASRLTFTKIIAVVTDFPGMMVGNSGEKAGLKAGSYKALVSWMLSKFDGYILLTQQMNEVVNPKNKPYMIMEGLVDISMQTTSNVLEEKDADRILIYAGGLYEKYGIKTLIDAFFELKGEDLKLHLYGKGQMVKDMDKYSNKDPRVIYMGIVPNEIVVRDQLKATLLINPRPTTEAFTKYSFPSKNMEYMVSGTPMVTTNLPGMPEEYHNFVYLFQDESVEGVYDALNTILSKTRKELHQFGSQSKNFVMDHKNNKVQAARILDFLQL
ncbi:glycosyltransferase [Muriicola sp. Z0-33]|uniref:glycosyltransferase n=1 Tax=Muriicola sp. Z0-33 TaxID=2816957 RepID=UPI002237B02D|nr:glycosyltransferase [Muriicola sp. Z0-33]MCW5515600.1 glycosyltransferase [Muriicola sp. Z0-33]